MQLNEILSNQLKEVLLEGKWIIGTNIKAQISDLSWTEAIHKVDSLNTIADLTFHISYYIAGINNVLEGGELEIRDKFSFDYPAVKSQQDWDELIQKFCSDSELLIKLVENLSEEKLAQTFVKEEYGTYFRNIEGIIEHSYYHFGQIVIIKKMIRNNDTSTK